MMSKGREERGQQGDLSVEKGWMALFSLLLFPFYLLHFHPCVTDMMAKGPL